MSTYTVTAIEKFLIRTTDKEILEGGEEWIETESVEEEGEAL